MKFPLLIFVIVTVLQVTISTPIEPARKVQGAIKSPEVENFVDAEQVTEENIANEIPEENVDSVNEIRRTKKSHDMPACMGMSNCMANSDQFGAHSMDFVSSPAQQPMEQAQRPIPKHDNINFPQTHENAHIANSAKVHTGHQSNVPILPDHVPLHLHLDQNVHREGDAGVRSAYGYEGNHAAHYGASPSYGGAQYGGYHAPAYSAPAYHAPTYGMPPYSSYSAPSYTSGHYSAPTYQAPAYQAPAYHAPAYQAPAYQAPAYQAPAYQAPAYQMPAYQAPAYQMPAYQAPLYSAPAYQRPSYDMSSVMYTSPTYASSAPTYSYPSAAPQVSCPSNLLFSCSPQVSQVPCSGSSYGGLPYGGSSYRSNSDMIGAKIPDNQQSSEKPAESKTSNTSNATIPTSTTETIDNNSVKSSANVNDSQQKQNQNQPQPTQSNQHQSPPPSPNQPSNQPPNQPPNLPPNQSQVAMSRDEAEKKEEQMARMAHMVRMLNQQPTPNVSQQPNNVMPPPPPSSQQPPRTGPPMINPTTPMQQGLMPAASNMVQSSYFSGNNRW